MEKNTFDGSALVLAPSFMALLYFGGEANLALEAVDVLGVSPN